MNQSETRTFEIIPAGRLWTVGVLLAFISAGILLSHVLIDRNIDQATGVAVLRTRNRTRWYLDEHRLSAQPLRPKNRQKQLIAKKQLERQAAAKRTQAGSKNSTETNMTRVPAAKPLSYAELFTRVQETIANSSLPPTAKPKNPAKTFGIMQKALRDKNKIYLHVPKTGSSFENAITRAFCPELHAQFDDAIKPINADFVHREAKGNVSAAQKCLSSFYRFDTSGKPILEEGKIGRRIVMLVRDPLKRIVSGYLNGFHDCPAMQVIAKFDKNDTNPKTAADRKKGLNLAMKNYAGRGPLSIYAYAECAGGCAARLLIGKKCGLGSAPLGIQEIQTALHMFDEHVAFAGITGRWHETLKVWKALTQTQDVDWKASEKNSRPSYAPKNLTKEIYEYLNGSQYVDVADEMLYQRATHTFNQMLEVVDKQYSAKRKEAAQRASRGHSKMRGMRVAGHDLRYDVGRAVA